ncbi:MFS transporter [Nocardioides sp. BP30]|uniref:MFS transporter n=1 Tax=Nocardioides sp. BP30 TaxID=3036374 RepID=UPI0024688F84|nr:MFS transporter [Nocardioides sp. BP30]WGL52647.1 MFS transporter [Nocardioides sp. BP30]
MTTLTPTASSASLRVLNVVMAVACGLAVANIYYSQPLLDLIAHDFGVSEGTASLVVTFTQAGYALGLLFLVPLGDLLESRALVTRMLLGTAVALALAAFSPVFGAFLVMAVLVGITSVVVQILVPMAAHLAPEGQEGVFVGKVMSGLLLGILLARSVASAIAQFVDWRAIYVISAVLMVVLSVVLRRTLPTHRPQQRTSYRAMLAGVVEVARDEPALRRKAIAQASMFGAFTAFWTAIAYELVGEHGFSQGQIALFALVGAGGAAAAPVAGRIADKGYGEVCSGIALLLASATFLLAGFGHGSILVLAVAAVLLDFAVQSHQVMGQHVVYGLRPQARARINTVYMTTIFVGGTLASLLTGFVHAHSGWTGVCWVGGLVPLVGFVAWLSGVRERRAGHAPA